MYENPKRPNFGYMARLHVRNYKEVPGDIPCTHRHLLGMAITNIILYATML